MNTIQNTATSEKINPYTTIDDFFDCFSLLQARHLLNQLLFTAESNKTWPGTFPCDTLWLQQHLETLIKSVYYIVDTFSYRNEVILGKDTKHFQLSQHQTWCGHNRYTPFQYFPRHLSQKEFINPYRALQQFTQIQTRSQWRETIKELVWHSLCNSTIDTSGNRLTTLKLYISFHKLIEACHLIHLRTKPAKQKHK